MGRLQQYLDIVPLWLLLSIAVIVGLFFILLPGRLRLIVAIAMLPPWLMLARMHDLGTVAQVAKLTSPGAYMLIIMAAILCSGPRRLMPKLIWIYPIMAFLSIAYVVTTLDRDIAIVIRFQWFLLTLAAVCVCRIINDEDDLNLLIRSLTIGCVVAVLIPFSAILLDPGQAFARGLGRFFPFGANPNHVGVLFALAAPLFLYSAIRANRFSWRIIMILMLGLPIGMGLMTGSRQTIALMVGAMFPLAVYLTRRPFLTMFTAAVLVVSLVLIFRSGPGINIERLTTIETGRFQIFRDYSEVISSRPIFGLLGTSGLTAVTSDIVLAHTHNAYLEQMYLGGMSYFLPMIVVMVAGMVAAWFVYRRRHQLAYDPLLISLLCAFYGMMMLHGLVGIFINYPTYAWSFFFVFLNCHLLATRQEILTQQFSYVPDVIEEEDIYPAADLRGLPQ